MTNYRAARVKLYPASKVTTYLGIKDPEANGVRIDPSYFHVDLKIAKVVYLTGEAEGEEATGVIKANQAVRITTVPLGSSDYSVVVSPTAELVDAVGGGSITFENFRGVKQSGPVTFVVRPGKQFDINDLTYVARVAVID